MRTRTSLIVFLTLLSAIGLLMTGCGGKSKPVVQVTVAPGTVSLNAGATQQFTATVTGTTSTAVTWSCSGTACGTITAAGMYTAPSLVPTYASVTVIATLQSDSTKSGSATAKHVAVKVTISERAVSTNAGDIHQFAATVIGSSNTGVTWSVSGSDSDCGSISATGLYTAPDRIPVSASVTVVATSIADTTKSDSVTVTHVPVSIRLADADLNIDMYEGQTHQYAVPTVNGTSNKLATWSLDGCTLANCGSVSSTGMYTAPATVATSGTVLVVATSQADPSKSGTGTVNLLPPPPIEVVPSPLGSVSVVIGGTQNFTVNVKNDTNNSGVTWALDAACTPATCGSLSNVTSTTVTYTAPATVPTPATVTLTATSVSDTTKSAEVVITVTSTPRLVPGDYALVFNGWEKGSPWPTRIAIVGRFHADANGTISGVEDINRNAAVSTSVAFTGTYTIGADRRGTLTVTTTSETVSYSIAMDATGTKANFIRFDSPIPSQPVSGAGYFEPQSSMTTPSGSYAFGLSSKPTDSTNMAAIGRATIGSNGTFSQGSMDVVAPLTTYNNMALTGSFGAASNSTGRGTAVLTVNPAPGAFPGTMNFVYYVVSGDKVLLLQSDVRGTATDFSGEALRQTSTYSTASFNVPVIYRMEGMHGTYQSAIIGQITPGGNGNLTGVRDQNLESQVTLNDVFNGTYAVDASGRATTALPDGGAVAYMFGQNQGFIAQRVGSDVMSGSFKPQLPGPYSASSMAATYRHGEPGAVSTFAECDSGVTTFDGVDSWTGSQDYTYFNTDGSSYYYIASPQSISGTYSMAANGRGQVNVGSYPLVLWMVSSDEIVALDTASGYDSLPVLLQYQK